MCRSLINRVWYKLVLACLWCSQPVLAEDCKAEIDRRFRERIVLINDKLIRAQNILERRIVDIKTPDDVIRAMQQDISKMRQRRDEAAVEWILIVRRHREPVDCNRE